MQISYHCPVFETIFMITISSQLLLCNGELGVWKELKLNKVFITVHSTLSPTYDSKESRTWAC